MQFAKIDGVTLHYRLTGDPAHPTLVFINSLGTDFRIWDDVAARLGDRFRILRYDKRGHGLSDVGRAPYTIEDHAGDLATLMRHLDLGPVILCGLSVGGMIAQSLALTQPDTVRAMVLCDTGARIGEASLWNDRIERATDSGLIAIAKPVLERWFTADYRTDDNPAFAIYRNMLVRTPVEGYTATCAAIRDADFRDRLSAIACPTLCLVGDADKATPPALVAELADLIPGARYLEVAGAGHLPCLEQPEVVADAVAGFLRDAKRE